MTNQWTRGPAQDRLFSAMFAGATGSAAVALLFLVLDSLHGDAFATPSLLGSVVFLGVVPSEVSTVRLDMVALYSLAHFVAFAVLGVAATAVHAAPGSPARNPFVLAGLLLAALSGGAFMIDAFALPGLVETIGSGTIILANTVASGAMAGFIHATTEAGASRASVPVPRLPPRY